MECSSFTFPAFPPSSTLRPKDIFKERISVLSFYSVNHLCNCINRIHAVPSKLPNSNRSIGIFPFQSSSSIVPNQLRSFLFFSNTSKHMKMQASMNMMGKFGESTSDQGEEIKGANWMEGLVALGELWNNIWEQKEIAGEDNTHHEGENDGCGSGGEEGSCAESCSLEENDGEMKDRYDPESFSRGFWLGYHGQTLSYFLSSPSCATWPCDTRDQGRGFEDIPWPTICNIFISKESRSSCFYGRFNNDKSTCSSKRNGKTR